MLKLTILMLKLFYYFATFDIPNAYTSQTTQSLSERKTS